MSSSKRYPEEFKIEAEARAQNLRKTLLDRKIHPDVLAFCRAELLVDNYFHAVLKQLKVLLKKLESKQNFQVMGLN